MEWAKGYELDYLKELSSPFRLQKPLVYGAFGLVKERDVASALSESRCCYNKAKSAVIIYKVLKNGSKKTDFRGHKIAIPSGTFYIQNFAAQNFKDGKELLGSLLSKLNDKFINIYIEIFEEDSVCKDIVANYDFIYQGTRISAGSEVYGIYKLNGQEYSYEEEEAATLLMLKENYITEEQNNILLKEIESYSEFHQHYSNYNKKSSWTAFAVKGFIKDDPSFIIKPSEMSKNWKKENAGILENEPKWLDISKTFPETKNIANQLGDTERVRFMKLGKGGELTRHADITDRNAGVEVGKIVRLHIPLIITDDVINTSWNHRAEKKSINFEKNNLYYLDQRKPHCVVNSSGSDRINLVIDVKSNNLIREMIANGL